MKPCDEVGIELTKIYSKIFPFYYSDGDSLNYYSDLFSSKITDYIKSNPSTFDCNFKSLSHVCGIVTTMDGLFRIYSWDTEQGGTAHRYKNIYQFKSNGKVYATVLNYEEGDMGTDYTDAFSLKANNKTYFLALSRGSESTKYGYEIIRAYSISGNALNDSVPLIKTQSGLQNAIIVEYDFSSVADRPERPIRLIRYDADKKIIYIPVVLENGTVTDRFIIYQFTGQYFEKILTQKKSDKQK